MRRALAAVLLAVSLWIGSLAWTGFIMTRTVLDPGRSEAVADALLDDPDVHDQLVANIAGGLESAIPAGFAVDRATLDAAAETALDSPEVEALFRTAFVDTHQAFLGEGDPPRSIDGGAFGSAARSALVESNPELDGLLPAAPSLEIPLPTERVPDLGPVRRALDVAVPILAAVAAVGALMALVITSNRPAILRRAGVWAIGLSAFVLVFAFGVPALAQSFAPAQAAVVASLIGALAEASQGPALALAGAGVAGLVASFIWKPTANAVRAEPQAAPPRQRRSPHPPTQRIPRQPRSRPGSRPPAPTRPAARPVVPPRATPTRPPIAPSAAAPAPTMVQRTAPQATPRPPVADQPGRRWVEGTGWVLDGSSSIPPDARWVPGVGYVVDG
ncbi:hypothetical protein [Actinospongicola halichondriae]|uniref:hypothetical protein n=1 Tax=Actinospongicola halichondriae TaxID=3236844 RepID=UPI003D3A9BC2